MSKKTVNSQDKPVIIAVETSGRIGSAAIGLGERLVGQRIFSGVMKHSLELFPALAELLDKCGKGPADIEQVYVSIGPGSFTGLRIATTMAKTMHLANEAVKIVAVDTLDVLAANAVGYMEAEKVKLSRVGAILDAKRGQFFVAVYEVYNGRLNKVVDDCLMSAKEFVERFAGKDEPISLLGEGLVYYKDRFAGEGVEFLDEKYWNPTAAMVHKVGWQKALQGQFSEAMTLLPAYLQRPDIGKKKL